MRIVQTSPFMVVENCKSKLYELRRSTYTANNSTKKCEVYFFTCVENSPDFHEKVTLPKDREVVENTRTGYLKVCKKGRLHE